MHLAMTIVGRIFVIFFTELVSSSSSIIEPFKAKPLQLIDDISEDLFKEVLTTDERLGSFNK